MKLTVKQNNIAQGSYSLCLVCVLLVIFYSIYGLGPGTHMEQRIASREQSIEHQPGMTVD